MPRNVVQFSLMARKLGKSGEDGSSITAKWISGERKSVLKLICDTEEKRAVRYEYQLTQGVFINVVIIKIYLQKKLKVKKMLN